MTPQDLKKGAAARDGASELIWSPGERLRLNPASYDAARDRESRLDRKK